MSEQKQKGLPDEISEKYKSEHCDSNDESKFESIQKDLAHDKSHRKAFQGRSKQQKDNQVKDSPHSKQRSINSVLALSSTDKTLQGAHRDTKFSVEGTYQGPSISEKIKSDALKTVIDRCIEKDSINNDRIGNVRGESQASGNFASTRYSNNYVNIQNTLHTALNNITSSGYVTKELFLRAQRDSGFQDLLNVFLFRCFLVAPDGDGDNDPECTKLTVDPKPLGRTSSLAAPVRYLINLRTKKEIHTGVLTKENFVDISKTIKPSIDKSSWNEKSEENDIDIYRSEEEEGNEDLASAHPRAHYCGEEMDDIIDQLVTCDFDDDNVQQFNKTQAVETEENQNQDDEDEGSVSNDSSSEAQEDGGGGMVLEDAGVSVQIRLTSEGVTVEEKGAMHSDCHELAGAGQTSPIDYTLRQSQLVGKQPKQSLHTWSETADIKHYLLANGSSITVTTNEVIAHLNVNTTVQESSGSPTTQDQPNDNLLLHGDNGLNNEGENIAAEQVSELPLTHLPFEQIMLPPTTMGYHSVLQFSQPEDQSTPLSDQVDTPTEDMPEGPYFDAVEAKPEEDSEEIESYPLSSVVSPPAENVDDEFEEIHIEPRKRSRWSNCCLL